jgi:hypothetical protein
MLSHDEVDVPIVAIVGNAKTSDKASAAAEVLGRELARAGFRILVYSSEPDFLECHVVRGYVASRGAVRYSIQVRYPLHRVKPAFAEQSTNSELFDWRPDNAPDWEMSFYQSLSEVHGVVLIGGGPSTLSAGAVARGHELAILALPGFGGKAEQVWQNLRPGQDLASSDEVSLMARPDWSEDVAAECVKALKDQLARKAEHARQRRLEEMRKEISLRRHAVVAALLFAVAFAMVPISTLDKPAPWMVIAALFVCPALAGISGATIRLVFDLRQGSLPLSPQSAITTGALGLIAGGVAGLLFITAQMATATEQGVFSKQAAHLVPFCFLIGFTAGMTLDAVFRKLIATDVLQTGSIETKKRS